MKVQHVTVRSILVLTIVLCSYQPVAAGPMDPWADHVVSYTPGSGIPNDFVPPNAPFDDPNTALGEPTRFTSDSMNFGGAVTPFNAPFRSNEVVTVGEGGELLVSFDEPVADDPGNPFGIDLLIFGNTFLSFVDGSPVTEGGLVEVSNDGVNFVSVPGVEADGVFPTLGFLDLSDPFPTTHGMVPSDFTRPVDPSFDIANKDMNQILAGYAGSGGGVGIDLSVTGLTQISHVRITNPVGSGLTPEVDALSDVTPVPEPASWLLAALSVLCLATRPNPVEARG